MKKIPESFVKQLAKHKQAQYAALREVDHLRKVKEQWKTSVPSDVARNASKRLWYAMQDTDSSRKGHTSLFTPLPEDFSDMVTTTKHRKPFSPRTKPHQFKSVFKQDANHGSNTEIVTGEKSVSSRGV